MQFDVIQKYYKVFLNSKIDDFKFLKIFQILMILI